MNNDKPFKPYRRENLKDQVEFILGQLRYEGELFSARVNMFLLAESILIVAYFYIKCSIACVNDVSSFVVASIGIVITTNYSRVFNRQTDNIRGLDLHLRIIDKDYKEIAINRGSKFSANVILGFRASIIFDFGWLLFIIIELANKLLPIICKLY